MTWMKSWLRCWKLEKPVQHRQRAFIQLFPIQLYPVQYPNPCTASVHSSSSTSVSLTQHSGPPAFTHPAVFHPAMPPSPNPALSRPSSLIQLPPPVQQPHCIPSNPALSRRPVLHHQRALIQLPPVQRRHLSQSCTHPSARPASPACAHSAVKVPLLLLPERLLETQKT